MIADCGLRIAESTGDGRGGMERFFRLCVLAFLFLFIVLPAAAGASSWSPEAVLRQYLLDHYPWSEVDVGDVLAGADLPASPPSAITVEKAPPGKSVFRFEFKSGRPVQVTAAVKVFDRVLMTRLSFRKGYVLTQDDFYPTLMESGRIPKGAVRAGERVAGKPLLRSVAANTAITDAMVSETPVVKRGRKVALLIETPGFSIKAVGEIRTDAAVGEYVKVANVMSNKIVTGLLVDEDTVRVGF